MVELKSIGEKRLEYLDLANKSWSANEFESVQNFMDSFLTTIRDGSQIADEIKLEFDKIEKDKDSNWEKLVKDTAQEVTQIQCEQRFYGNQELNLSALKQRLNFCWQVAIKYKLFELTAD